MEALSESGEPLTKETTVRVNTTVDPAMSRPFAFAKRPRLSSATELPSTSGLPSSKLDTPSSKKVGCSRDGLEATVTPLGEARRKKHLSNISIIAALVALICLALSILVVSPSTNLPWRLGLKRQLQVVGLLLSVTDLCRQVVGPKVFLMAEARFGKSYLQNYDAILRNTVVLSHTFYLWRLIILAFILLPTALSLAYKEFFEGIGSFTLSDTGGYYGLAAPGNLAAAGGTPDGGIMGISAMVNATLPYIQATTNDSVLPPFAQLPKAYGFNMLLLSNTSTAFLDAPMPDYVASIQRSLTDGERQAITAQVHATVTTYNSAPENHRNDTAFWDPYFNTTHNTTHHSLFYGTSGIFRADLYNGYHFEMLVNNFNNQNASWCFLALAKNEGDIEKAFQASALEFDTRRYLCRGSWLVTNDSIELLNGACDLTPLPDSSQLIITEDSLAFSTYYLPILSEYLGSFVERNQSQWLVPTFTTATAAMYWSRLMASQGFYRNRTKALGGPPYFNGSEVYYHVDDHIVSTRTTMNASWPLYLVLAIQPVLTLAAYIAALFFYQTPIDSGFGMIAILAGVRQETLRLLRGASLTGRVSKPVPMHRLVDDPITRIGKQAPPQIEYVLGVEGKNETLSHAVRYRNRFFASTVQLFEKGIRRRGTDYEMIGR